MSRHGGIRALLDAGQRSHNNNLRATVAWARVDSPFLVDALAHVGFDAVCLDMQHGCWDARSVENACRAMQAPSATAAAAAATTTTAALQKTKNNASSSVATPIIARVPWNEPAGIQRALDLGVDALIVPMVNTVPEALQAVAAARYPPLGQRSFGRIVSSGSSTKALLPQKMAPLLQDSTPPTQSSHDDDLLASLERENIRTMLFAQCETVSSVGELHDIVQVPGLDGIWVGPADLAISMGLPPQSVPSDAELIQCLHDIAGTCADANVIAAIHCGSGDMAREMFDAGYQMCSLASDIDYAVIGAKQVLAEARAGIEYAGSSDMGSAYETTDTVAAASATITASTAPRGGEPANAGISQEQQEISSCPGVENAMTPTTPSDRSNNSHDTQTQFPPRTDNNAITGRTTATSNEATDKTVSLTSPSTLRSRTTTIADSDEQLLWAQALDDFEKQFDNAEDNTPVNRSTAPTPPWTPN